MDPEIARQGHLLPVSLKNQISLWMKKRCPQKPAIEQSKNRFKSRIFAKYWF
jgi:hypothetical protein